MIFIFYCLSGVYGICYKTEKLSIMIGFINYMRDFFSSSFFSNEDFKIDGIYRSRDDVQLKQANFNNPIVVKCLSLITQSINALKRKVIVIEDRRKYVNNSYASAGVHARIEANANGNIKQKIIQLLKKPNNYQVGVDFINTIITHKLLYGNAYIVFENNNLFVLNPRYVDVSIKGENIIYVYDNDKIKRRYVVNNCSPSPLLHLKNPVRDLGFLGISSLEVAQPAINLYNYIFEWNEKVLSYNSKYSLAITLPTLVPRQFNEFKENFESKYGKRSLNALLLPNGADVKVLSKNPSEMGFNDLIRTVQSQIGYAFGVPQGVIDMSNITYSNAQKAKEIFYESNIFPEGEYIYSSLASFLSRMYGVEIDIEIDKELNLSNVNNIKSSQMNKGGHMNKDDQTNKGSQDKIG